MNGEQATFLVEYFANMLEMEGKTTVKVLAAVPDAKRGYKPDEKSRTAWDLATHIATSDVWFLDGIINGKFDLDPEAERKAEGQFKSVKEVVDFYNKEFPARLKQLRALSPDQLTRVVDFFGMFKWARRVVPRVREQPRCPSPRAARRLPARDGLEGAGNLRRQRR